MANLIKDACGSVFKICSYIGKGSFSKVYTLEAFLNKKLFAGKFISKEKLERYGIKNKVFDEIRIHQKLRHKNIVQFFTYIDQGSHFIMVMEYCSKYSLINVIHAVKTLTTSEAKYFMVQIVSAVVYLHKRHIVHRDLKLGNLFVNRQLEVKLGDFGLAVVLEYEGQRRFSRCGTPNYIAPEVINGAGHGFEVDVWALGCILHTMLEGTPPFQGENTTSTYNNILRCVYSSSPCINPAGRAFIRRSLQLDPKSRPTVHELADLEFMQSKAIPAVPPVFCFDQDERLSLVKRNEHNDTKLTLTNNEQCRMNTNPKDLFIIIFKYLSDIETWKDSNVGEFLAENCLSKPLIWVNCWIDYSNSYGFMYKLSNSNAGVIFNDRTKMLFQNKENAFRYVKSDETITTFSSTMIPTALQKKVKILMDSSKYMNDTLHNAHEAKDPQESPEEPTSAATEVFAWNRSGDKIAMFLSNGSIQVNFINDHIKLIVCAYTKSVTVIESINCMKTLKLEYLNRFGYSTTLKTKLEYVLKFIDDFVRSN